MKWNSAVSQQPSLEDAVAECAEEVYSDADLTIVFVSAHHAAEQDRLPELLERRLGAAPTIGCSAAGVIGAGHEVENSPGLAVTTALLPGVETTPFHIEDEDLPDGDAPPEAWENLVGARSSSEPGFILLTDPFSISAERLVEGLDYVFPSSSKVGGMASGASGPGKNALYAGAEVYSSGAVGVALRGNVTVDTIVAQGCRPIGEPMQVTACDRNILHELDGQKPLEVLGAVFRELSERDKELARHSLFLGVVMDPLNEDPQLGDFLIRNLVGADHKKGILALSELLREGQTVQFHLRDAETSALDLNSMLSRYAAETPLYEETGALLFSCLGRGSYLYGRPDHDTDMFRDRVNGMPLTGFFCNGEIGPVGGSTFIHGYTSSFAVIRPGRPVQGG